MTRYADRTERDRVLRIAVDDLATAHPSLERALVERIVFQSEMLLEDLVLDNDDLAERAIRFGTERIEALDRRDPPQTRVLVLSTRNDGMSQMAEAFLNDAGASVQAVSAGTRPVGQILRTVTDVMREVGVPVSGAFPKPLTEEVLRGSDVVITMLCPAPPLDKRQRTEDWPEQDPAGLGSASVRALRDRIAQRVSRFVEAL